MVDPFVIDAIDILLGAERHDIHYALGALVHQRTLLAREGCLLGVALDEILPDLRPDGFQPVAKVGQQRIVAAQRTLALQQVPRPQQGQSTEGDNAPTPLLIELQLPYTQQCRNHADDVGDVPDHSRTCMRAYRRASTASFGKMPLMS